MKKYISLICSLAVLLTLHTGMSLPVSAKTSGNFEYILLEDGTAEITNYTGDSPDVIIPSVLDGYTVTSIGDNAFKESEGNGWLESVAFPDTITAIGDYAFWYCSLLKSIVIPDSVKTLGEYSFSFCTGLVSASIGNGVTDISCAAFAWSNSLVSVTIGENVEIIGEDAFSHCSALKTLRLPNSVREVKANAFFWCLDLRSAFIGTGIEKIGKNAFGSTWEDVLEDMYYAGSEADWEKVVVKSDNNSLTAARWHFNTFEEHWEFENQRLPMTCANDGEATYSCVCGHNITKAIPTTGHTFRDNVCRSCGENVWDCVVSSHPYEEECDQTWVICDPGAESISVTFSPETETEEYYDCILIYDCYDLQVGYYTGTELASQTITVQGDTVKIRLVSDENSGYYGFMVTNVDVYREFVLGELTGDGAIDAADALVLFQYINKAVVLNDTALAAADISGDGKVNLFDAARLFYMVNDLI